MSLEKGYIPSEKEIAKAEDMLTPEQRTQSERRVRQMRNPDSSQESKVPPFLEEKIMEIPLSDTSSFYHIEEILAFLKRRKLYRENGLYRGANIAELNNYKNPGTKIWASTKSELLEESGAENALWHALTKDKSILLVFDGSKFAPVSVGGSGEEVVSEKGSEGIAYRYALSKGENYNDAIIAILKLH